MTQQFHSWVYIKKKKKNTNTKRYMHSNVHNSIIHNCQDMEVTWVSINRWMDKDAVYIDNGTLLGHKKEWNSAICSNMDGLRGHKSDRERQILYDITYME